MSSPARRRQAVAIDVIAASVADENLVGGRVDRDGVRIDSHGDRRGAVVRSVDHGHGSSAGTNRARADEVGHVDLFVVAFTAALKVLVADGRVAVTTCARAGSDAITKLRTMDEKMWREIRIRLLPGILKFR